MTGLSVQGIYSREKKKTTRADLPWDAHVKTNILITANPFGPLQPAARLTQLLWIMTSKKQKTKEKQEPLPKDKRCTVKLYTRSEQRFVARPSAPHTSGTISHGARQAAIGPSRAEASHRPVPDTAPRTRTLYTEGRERKNKVHPIRNMTRTVYGAGGQRLERPRRRGGGQFSTAWGGGGRLVPRASSKNDGLA